MEFQEALKKRCSCRSFTDKKVSDEDVKKIIAAAQNAPLALGDNQTSHLTVVRDPEIMEAIRAACMLKRKDGTFKDPLFGATTMIFFSATDISVDHIEYCNAGCVIENMCMAAADLGLGSCYIWGCLNKLRKNEEALALLKLPEGYEVLSAFVCGYPSEPIEDRVDRDNIAMDIL